MYDLAQYNADILGEPGILRRFELISEPLVGNQPADCTDFLEKFDSPIVVRDSIKRKNIHKNSPLAVSPILLDYRPGIMKLCKIQRIVLIT